MPFKPQDISKFSVIKLPYTFEGVTKLKRFVVIGHLSGYLIAIKPTSKMERYDADARVAAGAVIYEKGDTTCFDQRTAIEPDNQIPISHSSLAAHDRNGSLEILGVLPSDFREKLLQAIDKSITMEKNKKERIKKVI